MERTTDLMWIIFNTIIMVLVVYLWILCLKEQKEGLALFALIMIAVNLIAIVLRITKMVLRGDN